MCCKQARETRLYIALDRTEREREKEKVNRLHYANAVQLQLTVAKNRCRYRGMLSRTPEGVFTLFSFSFGHSLFFLLFLSLSLSIPLSVTLVPRFRTTPRRDAGMKWCRGCRSNRRFPIRALHRRKSPSRSSVLSIRSLRLCPPSLSHLDLSGFCPIFCWRTEDARSLPVLFVGTFPRNILSS